MNDKKRKEIDNKKDNNKEEENKKIRIVSKGIKGVNKAPEQVLKLLLYYQQEENQFLKNRITKLERDLNKLQEKWEERTRDDHDNNSSNSDDDSRYDECIICNNVGEKENELVICDNCNKYVCDECLIKTENTLSYPNYFCTVTCKEDRESKYKLCNYCGIQKYSEYLKYCNSCKGVCCEDCSEYCDRCERPFCTDCFEYCHCSQCLEENRISGIFCKINCLILHCSSKK